MERHKLPRRLRPRFGLSMLFLVVALICVWLGWKLTKTRDRQRFIYDELVSNLLTTTHWRALEGAGMQTHVTELAHAFDSPTAYRATFLGPDGNFKDQTIADGFETQLLKQWLNAPVSGTPPTNESAERGSSTYYRAIRATSTKCINCHQQFQARGSAQNSKRISVGDMIAIVKMEFPN